MSTDEKEDLAIDEDFTSTDDDEPEAEPAKTNLDKRRTIDNLLEERRLKRQLADYDFDV